MTGEEKIAVLLVTVGCLFGLAAGYQQHLNRDAPALMLQLLTVVLLILFAAGVQFRNAPMPWRPRMLLALLGVVALPLSIRTGAKAADLDFKYRRQKQYEALIASIKVPSEERARDWFEVPVPADFKVDAPVWARRQSDGHLHVEFTWSRKKMYVFCEEPECVPDEHWRTYSKLGSHWVLAFR
jgi:hypothetical protein